VGENFYRIAEVVKASIDRVVQEEIWDLKILVIRKDVIEVIEESNSKYENIPTGEITKYLLSLDQQWIKGEYNEIFENIKKNSTERNLDIAVEADPVLSEIIYTDKEGAAVLASGKISDYYQADEDWWKEAYNDGEGSEYIGELYFDESVKTWAIPMAIPVRNRKNNIIGICKAVLRSDRFFSHVNDIDIGKEGMVTVVDGKGRHLCHMSLDVAALDTISMGQLTEIYKSKKKWSMTKNFLKQNETYFISFSHIEIAFLIKNKLDWTVLVYQTQKEAFRPLTMIYSVISVVALIVACVFILMGLLFTNILIIPLRKLARGAEIIGGGNLDYKVTINTGDEIEELANSFNKMAVDLKKTTTSIDNLNKEMDGRKKAEDDARQAAMQWSRTFDAISDLVSIQDTEFRYVKVNRAFLDFVKMKEEDIVGVKCYELIHKTNKHIDDYPHYETLRTKKAVTKEIFEPRLKIYLEVTTSPIFDQKGNITGAVHITKNITSRKKAEQVIVDTKDQLEKQTMGLKKTNETIIDLYRELEIRNKKVEEAANIKTEFTSTVSHELRTPLTAIKEGIAIVEDETAGKLNESQKNFLGIAKNNVDRLVRLINDILNFQKLDAGYAEFDMKEYDVNKLIEEVLVDMKSAVNKKGLELGASLEKNLPAVKLDKDKIIQVLINLINNALIYTSKGSITVTSSKDNNTIRIAVSDTGMGIEKQNMTKLFKSFSQVHTGKDRKTGGTGLGLVICKKIIEEHRGKIMAQSEYGKGSTFSFILPIIDRRG